MNAEKQPWFAPKRTGYGAGLPIRWQGWVLLLAYIALATAAMPLALQFLPPLAALVAGLVGIAVVTFWFALIVRGRTAGGWRWRNREN